MNHLQILSWLKSQLEAEGSSEAEAILVFSHFAHFLENVEKTHQFWSQICNLLLSNSSNPHRIFLFFCQVFAIFPVKKEVKTVSFTKEKSTKRDISDVLKFPEKSLAILEEIIEESLKNETINHSFLIDLLTDRKSVV